MVNTTMVGSGMATWCICDDHCACVGQLHLQSTASQLINACLAMQCSKLLELLSSRVRNIKAKVQRNMATMAYTSCQCWYILTCKCL